VVCGVDDIVKELWEVLPTVISQSGPDSGALVGSVAGHDCSDDLPIENVRHRDRETFLDAKRLSEHVVS
jgi:hypothetical protein